MDGQWFPRQAVQFEGRGAPLVDTGPTIVWVDEDGDGVNRSSYSFSGVNLGTAAADRFIVVGLGYEGDGNDNITSVTIGGAGATQLVHEDFEKVDFYGLTVTTGTSATIAVSLDDSVARMAISVWALYGLDSTTPHDFDVVRNTSSVTSTSGTVSVPAGGVVMAMARLFTTTPVWTGVDGNSYAQYEAWFASGSRKVSGADASYDVQIDWDDATSNSRLSILSMR